MQKSGRKSIFTSNDIIQIQDVLCEKRLKEKKRAIGTSGTKKMQKLIHKPSENYLLNNTSVCVCVGARACLCVCHHSTPAVMVSKHCSYPFTQAFSFMACTGTALTLSSLGYRNLNFRRVQKIWHIYTCCNIKIYDSETSKYFNTLCIYTMFTLKLIFNHLIMKISKYMTVKFQNILTLYAFIPCSH